MCFTESARKVNMISETSLEESGFTIVVDFTSKLQTMAKGIANEKKY